ncbi:MAG TPA: aldehyde dehydrogenase family protein, partial [Polyangiaceae bacterium]|nr:aldehyde dehydrogenase family protein [Polyangiaceae bacterium]
VVNPANQELITELPEDDASSIALKVQRAREAQPAWQKIPLDARLECIQRFKASLHEQRERLANVLSSEVGKPIQQAYNELDAMPGRIDFFLEHTRAVLADEVVQTSSSMEEKIGWEPLGVIANVSAWNYPYFVGSNVFVPALLTGNTVLYKPSEYAALTGQAITELLHDAGVPQEVFQCVQGDGRVGAALVAEPVDGVFFTGSYATGRRIAEAVAPRLIKVQLELGGKDPGYVTEDVDVAAAVASLSDGAFYNAGQSCCSVERIYVHEAVASAFIEQFVAAVQGFVVGEPSDPTTYIGPLAREAQLAVLDDQVQDALQRGAQLLLGGKRMVRPGNYWEPTVLTQVSNAMKVMREESFGPVIGIQVVHSDDEAVGLMNDTDYGLTAGVYCKNRERAETLLKQLNSGSVYWNCCDRVSPRLPWTGRRHSGIGSTLSTHGIRAFLQPKAWHLRTP